MARDDHPRIRQAQRLERKVGKKSLADRVLIVSEGTKTEPNYFDGFRASHRLQTATIRCVPSSGTAPIQVVSTAEDIFLKGEWSRKIDARAFEKVFAVFDRDEHPSFDNALDKANAISKKGYRNDLGKKIVFTAISSVPSFELWLLLHFEQCTASISRNDVNRRLNQYFDGNYEKSRGDHYEKTKSSIDKAILCATELNVLKGTNSAFNPSTDVYKLIEVLRNLKG